MILDLKTNNIIEYILLNKLISALKSRNNFIKISKIMLISNILNKFDSLNRILKLIVLELIANNSLDYINRTSKLMRLIPLGSKII